MSDEVYDNPVNIGSDSVQHARFSNAVRIAFDQASTFRQPYTDLWNYNFRLLNGRSQPSRGAAWRTNRFVNIVRVASLLLKSRFYQGLPVAEAQARTLQSSINQESMNDVLLYDQERAGLETEMGKAIEDGINNACAVMYEGWRTETVDNVPHTRKFWDRMVAAIRKHIPKFKESQILYDGPEFRWVDLFSFYWDPNGTDIDDCSYVMEVTYETAYQLRKDPSIDQDVLDRAIRMGGEIRGLKAKDADERLRAMGLSPTDARRVYGKIREGLYEKILYWGAFDIDDDGREEEVKGILLNGTFTAFLEENPFNHGKKPYSKWSFNDVPGMFVGYSLLDQAAQSQEEINDLSNQNGDVRKIVAKPIIFVKLGADFQPDDFSFAPGALVPRESPDDVEFYQPDTSALIAILEQQKYEREMFQLLTGMNDVSLGQKDVGIGDNTATGAAIAEEQTELRYKAPAIGLDLFVQRLGEMQMWNEQQFRNSKEVVPVHRAGVTTYQEIRPKDISGLFSYRIVSSSLTNQTPTARINNLMKALEVIKGDPNYDPSKLVDELVQELGIDPKTLRQPAPSDMGDVSKLAALPPEQQQAAIDKLGLRPEDRELLQKAIESVTSQNASPPGTPAPQVPNQGIPLQGGGVPGLAQAPPGVPPMAGPPGPPLG